MRHRAALPVLLAGLLMGALLPAVAPASSARRADESAVSARLAPPVVTVGEPTGLVAQVTPARAGRTVTLESGDGTAWAALTSAVSDGAGRVFFPLGSASEGSQSLRVVAARQGTHREVVSGPVTLRVLGPAACSPRIPLVDTQATPEARCLGTRLDRWKAAGLTGVGQQLNVSNKDYLDPLTLLEPQRVSVVGFDVDELAAGETYSFEHPPLQNLLRLAQEGAVLTASWHAPNPHTQKSSADRSWHDLDALLDETTPEAQAFWADYDQLLALFLRLQSGDGGAYPPAAVVFRPLHEANGDWFWWGQPNPVVYAKVWARMQARAFAAGVHNIVWAYSFGARTDSRIVRPDRLLPDHVDLGGLDSYDPETGKGQGADRFDMRGWLDVAEQLPRMAITEAGPHGSSTGAWNPAVITRTAKATSAKPIWAMLWFDDGGPDKYRGKKQISSLRGGPAWLRSCANGFCSLR